MAISEAELRAEALGQLTRLVQSPGWALLQMRLAACSRRNEAEKASLLRTGAGEKDKVVYLQGVVDGLAQVEKELQRALGENQEESPAGY